MISSGVAGCLVWLLPDNLGSILLHLHVLYYCVEGLSLGSCWTGLPVTIDLLAASYFREDKGLWVDWPHPRLWILITL